MPNSVEIDLNMSVASLDGNVGKIPLFKPKMSGHDHAMVNQAKEQDKEDIQTGEDLMTVNKCHSFSVEGFFESQ